MARRQGKSGLLVHLPKQGRPRTVFPLIEEVIVPPELVENKELLVTPAGSDVPRHMFPKKRKTFRENAYGHYDAFYFSPLVVIFGPQLRLTMFEAYDFSRMEKEVMEQLTTQYDTKLKKELVLEKRNRQPEPDTSTAPSIPFSDGDDSNDDSDDEEEKEREREREREREERRQKKREERKANKPVEGGLMSCAELGVSFIFEPFSDVQDFTRDPSVYKHVVSSSKAIVSSAF